MMVLTLQLHALHILQANSRASAVALLVIVSACQSSDRILPPNLASTLVNGSLQVGMTRSAVVAQLGEPHRVETNGNMEFLFYRSPLTMAWATWTSNPIAVLDGKVVGLGSSFYSEHRAVRSD